VRDSREIDIAFKRNINVPKASTASMRLGTKKESLKKAIRRREANIS